MVAAINWNNVLCSLHDIHSSLAVNTFLLVACFVIHRYEMIKWNQEMVLKLLAAPVTSTEIPDQPVTVISKKELS